MSEPGSGEAPERRGAGTPSLEEGMEEFPGGKVCDFCGERVPRVRRVALDEGYERLRTPHRELYACRSCSEQKERERLGLAHR